MVMARPAGLTVQLWGNSLAVRIPATVARTAHFSVGQPVEVTITDDGLLVKRAGMAKLALAQKLAALDLARHGGEAMATCPAGTEAM